MIKFRITGENYNVSYATAAEYVCRYKEIPLSAMHMQCTEAWLPGWLEWVDVPELEEVIF